LLYERWAKQSLSFDQAYKNESTVLGHIIEHRLKETLRLKQEIQMQKSPVDLARLADQLIAIRMKPEMELFHQIIMALNEDGIPLLRASDLTLAYLKSDEVAKCPYIDISSSLYAEIAQRISMGAGRKIGELPFNDVSFIAAYLPYCDAVFVDREMHGLLQSVKVSRAVKKFGNVFSVSNKNDFIRYLDGILEAAPELHLKLVRARYGPKWEQPYFEALVNDLKNREDPAEPEED